MRRPVSILLATGICALALVGAGCASQAPATGEGASDPAALIAARCTKCHSIEQIKLATHDAAGWAATVTRMRKNGAQVSDAEAQAIIDFLASGGASKL